MKSNRNIIYFLRNFNKKHRLSLRKQHDDTEVWYMHTSPLEFLGGAIATVVIIFLIILTLVAYTPVLNMIPGYHGDKSLKLMIQNIMRIDSIERKLNEISLYTNDVTRILEDKTPVTQTQPESMDSLSVDNEIIPPNRYDSILRSQMEGSGVYGLAHTTFGRSGVRTGMELTPPVRGVVATHFNPKENRYGTGISTAGSQQVLAVEEGTVILSLWSPGSGYTIQIQHPSNLISIYRNCIRVLHSVGSRVRSGEVIGYTSDGISGEDGKGLFEIELWRDGAPVDPESYILL